MTFEQSEDVLKPEINKMMKRDLYQLIRRYCKSYKITGFKRELFLHDSTRIEYSVIPIVEVERFIALVNTYWSYFSTLISALSFDEEMITVEHRDRIVGNIDLIRTGRAYANQQAKRLVICTTNKKHVFTYENILLASVILGINLIARLLLRDNVETMETHFKKEHQLHLEKIVEYTQLLLKDRLLKRLVDHYLLNYENMEQLKIGVDQRLNQGKMRSKYFGLIRFIQDWKNFTWMLNEPSFSYRKSIAPYLEFIEEDRLYEIWIFYKIMSLFEPVYQRNNNTFVNDNNTFWIEYHREKNLGWILEKKHGMRWEVKRYPDIIVRRKGQDAIIIDAKCMRYSEKEDNKEEPGPDTDIVNQMLIYLDYERKCDLGIVLFADDKLREDVIMKQSEFRQILFLNCYPYHDTASLAFQKITNCLSIN